MARRRGRSWLRLAVVAVTMVLGGCQLLNAPLPEPTTLDDRLAAMPTSGLALERPVTVRWNAHQVPYIFAQSDQDAAYALGLVHAHLRLGQMEMLRRIAQGRIAEMAGPFAAEIDGAVRAVGLYRAASESVAQMPAATRAWVERYCQGLNDYRAQVAELPYEVRALRLEAEPWRPEDLVAIGRLGSIDVNWGDWLRLLPSRGQDGWEDELAKAIEPSFTDPVSFGGAGPSNTGADNAARDAKAGNTDHRLAAWIEAVNRVGSNSMVVAGARSATGSAMIASDPHLGFILPNVWLLAGLKTPDKDVVGMMAPGLPIFALGRTPYIAWGGTNLRAASSDLVDVSTLDPEAFTTERHDITVRAWFDETAENRVTAYGPVVTDVEVIREAFGATQGDQWALRWTAHDASDEFTSMLKILTVRDFEGFREAFGSFSLPGQNMLYADVNGEIGHILATRLPRRADPRLRDLVITPAQADRDWAAFADSRTLPAGRTPESGFFASSNNRPTVAEDVPVGYFFSPPDRFLRATDLLTTDDPVTMRDLEKLQQDTFAQAALDLRNVLVARLGAGFGEELGGDATRAWTLIREWNGLYERDAVAPVAFEAFVSDLGAVILPAANVETPPERLEAQRFRRVMIDALAEVDDATVTEAARASLSVAAEALDTYASWGAMHRLRLNHPLAILPLVGDRFPSVDLPAGGSSETLMKTSHQPTTERHNATYGSQGRHISDMSDPDGNYFLLAGGQDGWLNSSTFADQAEMWQAGEYIQMPLSQEAIVEAFPFVMELRP